MILRRVIEHVKAQQWTAVFLDFVIVVLGVFIGIQVSNWNAARHDAREAREYIERIQEDLLANQQDMAMRADYFADIKAHALAALNAREKLPEDLGDQFLVDSFIASYSLTRSFQRNTYDELLSAGAMNKIPNVDIRNRIAEYYRVAEGSQYYMNTVPSYVDALRGVMPYGVQAALRDGGCNARFSTDARGAIAATAPENCPLDNSLTEKAAAIRKLLAADLEADLTRALADFDLKIQIFKLWEGRAQVLYDYLEETK